MVNYSMFTDKSNVVAVVGATDKKDKFGYRVYKTMKGQGYKAYPVNPNYSKIDGDKVYPALDAVPDRITLVITVTPRAVALEIVKKCKELGIPRVWMQPGSESDEAVIFCRKNGIEVIYNACFIADGVKTPYTA